jgi:O-antigen/teichoic acid export membrane protein
MSSEFFYLNYLQVTFRAQQAFLSLAKIQGIQIGIIFLSVLLVYFHGYYGLVIRSLLTQTSFLFLAHLARPIRVRPKYSRDRLISLVKVGLPIFSYAYLNGVAYTLPRLVLLTSSGVKWVGLFAPAEAIVSMYIMFPSVLAQYIYPQMSFTLGKSNDPKLLWPMAWKSAAYIFVFSFLFSLVGWFLLPWVIEGAFPQYLAGVFAAQLALIIGPFRGSMIGMNALYSLKSWPWLTLITIVNLVLSWVFPYAGSFMNNPLDGVALGALASQAAVSVLTLVCIQRATFGKSRSGYGAVENPAATLAKR